MNERHIEKIVFFFYRDEFGFREKGREKKRNDRQTEKIIRITLPAPSASIVGPCLTIIQIESYSAHTPAERKKLLHPK